MSEASTDQPAEQSSVFAPLRTRVFAWLWIGVVASSIGSFAQTVGAQWLFIQDPGAATIVSLVAAANALPVMLLALPAGVISDAFDRRRLMIGIQVYAISIAVLLAVLAWSGGLGAPLLLAFTFLVGAGLALQLPTWQPSMTELVPRSQIAAATRLDMINVNVARAAGPAIAGVGRPARLGVQRGLHPGAAGRAAGLAAAVHRQRAARAVSARAALGGALRAARTARVHDPGAGGAVRGPGHGAVGAADKGCRRRPLASGA